MVESLRLLRKLNRLVDKGSGILSLDVIIFLGGLTVSGKLIDSKTYYKEVSERFKHATGAQEIGALIGGLIEEDSELIQEALEEEDAVLSDVCDDIYLKDVSIITANSVSPRGLRMEELSNSLVAIKHDAVDGFMLVQRS